MDPRLYCIDTSSLIRAWVEAYPEDVVPSFWNRLHGAIEDGHIIAPEEVQRELTKRSDGLRGWCKQRPRFFVDIDDDQQDAITELLGQQPMILKNRKGAHSADGWVVSLAKVRGAVVVSEEDMSDSQKRPKIPAVCKANGVDCVNLLGLMRALRWRL